MARVSESEQHATRQRLLEAGKQEFADRGLTGARFDEISLAAGHAKGTIYNYFDNKEALFFAIVSEWCNSLVDAFIAPEGASARQQLLVVAATDVEIARKDPDLARVVVQQTPGLLGVHRDQALHAISPALRLLESILSDGLDQGEFTVAYAPHVGARLFLTTLSGFEAEALLPEPPISLDEVVDLVDRHFIQGLRIA